MFTGIVEEKGVVQKIAKGVHCASLVIAASKIMEDLHVGDSIAVNGVCLTVTEFAKQTFQADVMPETMNRSSLGMLRTGNHVNLERAMPANGRFGGHIVSGHIDGTGVIAEVKREENAVWYTISAGENIMRYIIEKGSVAIDGISLTVAKTGKDYFKVSVIPHTMEQTILPEKRQGDKVNLENDQIGKYIEHLLGLEKKTSGITMDFLHQYGF